MLHTKTISALHAAVTRYDPWNRDVSHLLGSLHRCFCNFLHEHEGRQRSADANILLPKITFTGHPGRPRCTITSEQIFHSVSIGGMTWQKIVSCFGISRRTLHRHRVLLGIEPLRYKVKSNQELDSLVTVIFQNTPNAGETHVLGSLRSRHSWIQHWWDRDSLYRVDPIGPSFRRSRTIRHRAHSVRSLNCQLW